MRSYKKSSELYERARQVLAGGVSSAFRAAESPHPLFFARAEGARMWDVDGNESLDFTLSQGPMILGHCNPLVHAAVSNADSLRQVFAAQHIEELELAEALQRLIPCAELVRFCVSGSEAAQAALRVARAFTGRSKFIKFEGHYHGWLDSVSFSVNPPSHLLASGIDTEPVPWTSGIAPSVVEDVIILPWNDLELVERVLAERGTEIAAVITEPMMCNNGCVLPETGYLEGIRAACDRAGSVLIFDEIITGFRVAAGGAQSLFGVTPDLAIFGKAMGSGFPISALVGKRNLMDILTSGKAIQAGTMNAQNASVAAALSTVTELEKRSDEIYPRFERLAASLRSGLEEAGRAFGHPMLTQGVGPAFHMGFTTRSKVSNYREVLSYDAPKYQVFVAGMRQRGVRLIARGLWYLSVAHTEADIDHCVRMARETLSEMKSTA